MDIGPGVAAGGGEGIRVHVVDLAGAGAAVHVDELVAHRDDRHPWLGVDEHLGAPDRGEQSYLGGTDDASGAYGHITRLDVVAHPSHVLAGLDLAGRADALARLGRGPAHGQNGIGQRGQRPAGVHADALTGLEAGGLAGTGGDLPDDGQGGGRSRSPPSSSAVPPTFTSTARTA